MKKPTEWSSEIDGKSYAFSHQIIKGKHTLAVNGVSNTIKAGFVSSVIGFDEKFDLEGKEARLVMVKNEPDIVVDDVFLRSGKNYVQRPAWAMVFIVACILIPIISLGGALPIVLGFGGAGACVAVSKTSLTNIVRIILCIAITILAWVLWFLLILGVSMMR